LTRAVLARDDKEVARDPCSPRLIADRREPEASRHVPVGEAREWGALSVGGENEDLLLVTISHEQAVTRADSERGDHRAFVDNFRDSLRRDSHDLARALLIRRL